MRPLPAVLALALPLAAPLAAQERIPSDCAAPPAVAAMPERLHLAGVRDPLAADAVRISFIDHASALIQTPDVAAVTDYSGLLGPTTLVPDVATMNIAHSSHWTPDPDPRIAHVLPGWAEDGVPAAHSVDLGEMLVRNVPTDLRDGEAVTADGNSIFVFEAAGLCIGHLGHLHHMPTEEDFALIGRLDVVLAPVDGGLTLDHATMIAVLEEFRARVVIPVHWWSQGTLERFLDGMSPDYAVERTGASEVVLSLDAMPERPTIVVLEPSLLSD